MKNLLLLLISYLFVSAVNVVHANAVPDIRGEYSGSYSIVVSDCTEPSSNGTYYAVLSMSIPTQTGNTFSASATGTFDLDGSTATEYIQLTGTITETGQISGETTHTFLGTGGEGTFTGQLSGNTLSIENAGHDTYGETCTYIRYMSATREGEISPSANFNANPTSGKAPLSVNFIDESVGTITSWDWNFGFGMSSNIQNPSHTYTYEGKYSVKLTVSGPYGSDTMTKYDYISVAGISNSNESKILPSDVTLLFSYKSVAISDTYAIVGAIGDDDKGYYSGAVYIFERNGSSWNQVDKITASDGAATDVFGRRVSISGDYAIVGAEGAAYILERNGNSWNQVDKLTASDGAAYIGRSVSISGDYAIVGAVDAAYIFERNGSSWNQVDKLTASDADVYDDFGYCVSISGGYAIVGNWKDSDNGYESGSAYIFERNGSSWNQVDKLTASDGAARDNFGSSVSISGGYAIVGAGGDDYNGSFTGSAYIFRRNDSNWGQVDKLTASDGIGGDDFGSSVSISGDYAIVGALNDDDKGDRSGSAYIFKRNGNSWNQVDKLTASDGAPGDNFGGSVSICGGYAIVGADGDDDIGLSVGSAYIFDSFPGYTYQYLTTASWTFLLLFDDF